MGWLITGLAVLEGLLVVPRTPVQILLLLPALRTCLRLVLRLLGFRLTVPRTHKTCFLMQFILGKGTTRGRLNWGG